MLIEGLDYAHVGGDEYNPYGREYKTLRDYEFFFRTHRITIPAGYMWDGPTGLPFVGTINSGWLEPSLRHDYLYEEQGRIEGVEFTREEVDELFFSDLRANGVSVLYVWFMRYVLDSVFERVWNDTGEGSTKTLKRYMVPFLIVGGLIFAAIASGLIWYAPTILGFFM